MSLYDSAEFWDERATRLKTWSASLGRAQYRLKPVVRSSSSPLQRKKSGGIPDRQHYWRLPFPPGITVDQLAQFRRRHFQKPCDNLHPEPGAFCFLRTEYKKAFQNYFFRGEGELPQLEYGFSKRAKRKQDFLTLEGSFSFNPEYKEKFVEFPRERPSVKRPQGQFPVLGEDDLQRISEIHAQYVRYLESRRADLQRKETILRPEGDFLGRLTEHQDQFTPKTGQRPELIRRSTYLQMKGEFGESTENKDNYITRLPAGARRDPIRRPPNLIVHEGQMDMTTENTSQYVSFGGGHHRPDPAKPPGNLNMEGGREYAPEYREKYVEYPRAYIAKRHEAHLRPEGDIGKTTELSSEFVDFHPERPNIRRQETNLKPEGEFSDKTELRSEFVDFPRQRDIAKRHDAHLKPEGEFRDASEVKSEYVDFPRERHIAKRHDAHLKPEGEFRDASEVKSEYVDFPRERNVAKRHDAHLKMEGEFRDASEGKSEFVDFPRERHIAKRHEAHLKPEGQFRDASEIKSEYVDFPRERPIVKKQKATLKQEGEFANTTELRSEYVDFPRERQIAKRHDAHLKPEGTIDAHPESEAYVNFPRDRPVLHRTDTNLKPEGQMDAVPESTEYANFQRGRPVLHRTNTNLKSEGKLEATTESSQYHQENTPRPVIQRPHDVIKKFDGRIDADPEYRSSFLNHARERPTMARTRDQMDKPAGNMLKASEMHEQYVRHEGSRAAPTRRPPTNLHMEGDLHGEPEYRAKFADPTEAFRVLTFPGVEAQQPPGKNVTFGDKRNLMVITVTSYPVPLGGGPNDGSTFYGCFNEGEEDPKT